MRFALLCLTLLGALPAMAQTPNKARQTELINLLKHDCGSCHGLTLKGGLGPSLLKPDLQNKSNNFLVDTIQNGRKGTPMPAWRPFLNKDETLWLVKHLKNQS
jgi:cytochrome c55X